MKIDLNTPDLIGSKEASLMWGKQKDYVRTIYNKYPERFPAGTIRKFGKQIVVTENFSLLDSKPKEHQQNNAGQVSTPGDPFANGGQSIDITDEDLPF